jgi:hypothetical protein
VCLGLSVALLTRVAAAQPIRPWTPPSSDSLLAWAAEARTRFQSNAGDSIGGENFKAYELVGRIGRRMLVALGRTHMLQAHAIEPAIDSLGLDTEVTIDPDLPSFALLMVHNPFRPSAGAVAWLFWYRQTDLRVQGVQFRGGREPRMKVWWTGAPDAPYEWAVLDRVPGKEGYNFTLFRLAAEGYYWRADQYEGVGPDLGDVLEAGLLDVNRDGRPELLAWAKAAPDSLFEACSSCPSLLTERLYTSSAAGFELDDSRLVPTAYSTFVLFIRLLHQHNGAAASRVLEDPTRLERAVALGWGGGEGRGLWKLEYVDPDRPWPHWLAVKLRGPKGEQRWIVHFTQKEGRWVIRDWQSNEPRGASRRAPSASPDSATSRRGARPVGGR